MRTFLKILVIVVILAVLTTVSEAKRKRKKVGTKSMILRQKETNAIEFIRLAAMRLIYGIATRIGLGEQISEALNGAFVPPGVDDYDYGGGGGFGGLFDREDDDDYDY